MKAIFGTAITAFMLGSFVVLAPEVSQVAHSGDSLSSSARPATANAPGTAKPAAQGARNLNDSSGVPNRGRPPVLEQEEWATSLLHDDVTAQTYDWPTGHEVPVIRAFAAPEERWLPGHRGVDLAADEGSNVLAAGDGEVIYAGRLNDRNLVSIEHPGGLRTTYEPVSPAVSKGDRVVKGEVIGTLETGHFGPAPVLHWGAKFPEDRYIDPLSLLNQVPIRLWE
ncbi:peptidoglycan DD-metalloendopeptidase family protein [Actinomycetaceae bacterium L2_0104]